MKPSSFVVKKLEALGFETSHITKLQKYVDMMNQWQKAINLVSPSTLSQIWERHILDSAQLWPILQKHSESRHIIDLGSGGGLPAIVMAIINPEPITMIESDQRKGIFLREVSRETGLTNTTVLSERIEKAKVERADIITARALAPLMQLIEWSEPLVKENGMFVFLKGQDAKKEIASVPRETQDRITLYPSITDKDAHIVVITK